MGMMAAYMLFKVTGSFERESVNFCVLNDAINSNESIICKITFLKISQAHSKIRHSW